MKSVKKPRFHRPLASRKYIITSAQNDTPVNKPFLAALKVAAKALGAELVVVPFRYKNPTSIFTSKQKYEEWWDADIQPFLFNQRKKLGPNLVLAGDVKVQPTASSPLTGFEGLTGTESCILGHPRMQFLSVPVPSGAMPKILSTTGAVTERNYTDSKAGKLGSFHHCLGAIIVELQGRKFHLRQINADRQTGSFTDLDRHYTPEGVTQAPRALGLVLGDTHARFADKKVDKATFGPGGIVDVLNPMEIIWHDLLDGYSVNPHHEGNPLISVAKVKSGLGDVREEIEYTVKYIADRTTHDRKSVVVSSNHDNFLSRWINNTDWRRNPGNADFYLETASAMVKSTRVGRGGTEYIDPFTYWVAKLRGDANIYCLGKDESHTIAGIECGLHGDKGPNGSKGTLKNLSRLGQRVISGHQHAPGIEAGHYKTGTSTPLSLEYTGGPSSWLNTHVIIYATGKRALITIIDGSWRASGGTSLGPNHRRSRVRRSPAVQQQRRARPRALPRRGTDKDRRSGAAHDRGAGRRHLRADCA